MTSLKNNAKQVLKQCGNHDKTYRASIVKAAKALAKMDNIVIISHRAPDGDTLGSASALCRGLRSLGKHVNCICADDIPEKYAFMLEGIEPQTFAPQHFVSVDIAAPHLMGKLEEEYSGKIEICIDHHHRNSIEAPVKFVDTEASATGELIWMILKTMGIDVDAKTAACLFGAISTDTGCFKYSNVTPQTHIIAVELMKTGIDCAKINFKLIEEENKAKLALKSMALSTLEYFCDDKCAVVTVTSEMMEKSGAKPEDMDGIASIPRSISGVECGITMKQEGDAWKISVRSSEKVNASDLCGKFGGGGHAAAAGCKLNMNYEQAKDEIVKAAAEAIGDK